MGTESTSLTTQLDEEIAKARETLRSLDESYKTLTGRNEFEFSRFNRNRAGVGRAESRAFSNSRFGAQDSQTPFSKRKQYDDFSFRDDETGHGFLEPWKRPRFSSWESPGIPIELPEEEGKVPKPAVASSVMMPQKDLKTREEAINELKENEERQIAVRNRRMFGMLLSTLQKFSKDEKNSFKEQEKRQKEIEAKLEETKRKEHAELEKEKQRLAVKRKSQQTEIRRLQKKKAVIASSQNQIAQLQRLHNFIQTIAKPPIFYLPAKHTLRTIEMQKKSQKRLDEIIKQKQAELDEEVKEIDDLAVQSDDVKPKEDVVQSVSTSLDVSLHNENHPVDSLLEHEMDAKPKDIHEELNELNAGVHHEDINFEDDDQRR